MIESKKKILANRYIICGQIGKGSNGNIYKAFDTLIEDFVAIKHNSEHRSLKEEFRILSDSSHEHIIDFYDFYIEGHTSFFTMEWLDGDIINKDVWGNSDFNKDKIDYKLLRKYIFEIAKGIQHLHNSGILHRDIKPENIIVKKKKAILLDFGLARKYCGYIDEWVDLNKIDGTYAYMPPEVLNGRIPSPASDWYSLGIVLYQCLTGIIPDVIFGNKLKSPIELIPQTPLDLNDLTLGLLEKNEGLRHAGFEIITTLKSSNTYHCFPKSLYYPENFVGRKKELFF